MSTVITVRHLVEALRTYPADSEIFLDSHTLHAHVGEECYEVWSDDSLMPNPPENYHPIIELPEVDDAKIEGSRVWRYSGIEWVDCGPVGWA